MILEFEIAIRTYLYFCQVMAAIMSYSLHLSALCHGALHGALLWAKQAPTTSCPNDQQGKKCGELSAKGDEDEVDQRV